VNNIFVKNIAALVLKNPNLAKKLQSYLPTEVPKVVQENGAYNLLYKEKMLHNVLNPLAEAQQIFAMAKNEPVSIHIIYGLGLGYLFQFAARNSKGAVILYEPDLNILWSSLTVVDFSNDFLQDNVFITDTFEDLSEAVYKKSGMKNSPELLSLSSQRELDAEGFNEFVSKIKNTVGSFYLDLKYTKEKFYPSLKMLFANIPNLMNETPLIHLKDFLKGKTAVLVSAGPTLDRNIETLKKYRNKYVLFTVGTAVKTLYQHGIKPDFLSVIETYNSTKQLEGLDLSDVNFITEPYSHSDLRKFKFKKRYSHISANMPINLFWGEICDEKVDEYWSKGTVSYTILNCARLLGCSKIILVGQDLAYIEGHCYSKDSAYKDLICGQNPETGIWEIMAKDLESFANSLSAHPNLEQRVVIAKDRLKNLNNSLHIVKGINGNMLPTESVYAAFVKPLSEYALHFNDRDYINTSLVGAQIDGFKNISLEEALKDVEDIESLELNVDFNYDKNLISSKLNNKLEELKSALSIIENGKKDIKNLNNEIKRYRNANQEVLKLLKKVSLTYLSLSSDFSNKSEIFNFITSADKINLDYEMKMTTEFTVETTTALVAKIEKFYTNAEKRIDEIDLLLKNVLRGL